MEEGEGPLSALVFLWVLTMFFLNVETLVYLGVYKSSYKCALTLTSLETKETNPHRTHSSICDHFGLGGDHICIFTGHF